MMPTSSAGNEGSTEVSSDDAQNIGEEMDLSRLAQNAVDEARPMITPALTTKEKIFKYLKIVGPHVGLVSLLVIYLLMGATLFHYIEAPHEIETRETQLRTIFGLRDAFQETIWNLTRSETAFPREAFNKICKEYFEKLAINMFEAYRIQYITERHLTNRTKSDQMMWTYANSVFFSTTVITTIGYGNLVPTTEAGRIACIFFALFGIPLLLVTIADIGKFFSDFLKFVSKSYQNFKTNVRKHSHRLSQWSRSQQSSVEGGRSDGSEVAAESLNLEEMEEPIDEGEEEEEEESSENELKIPVVMVLFVLICYCALGGLLFQMWEGWPYFDAFYFCFITMATVGFGDLYPTESSTYIILAYIIFGLSLATMCIDLAGTEYIRKIHYIGTKMEDAQKVVKTGGTLLKTTGIEFIRTTSGKLVQVRGVLNPKQARELGLEYILSDMQFQQKNILYEPPSQAVQKLLARTNIKILPDDITEDDGLIIQNQSFGKPVFFSTYTSPNAIHKSVVPAKERPPLIIPFVLKESQI